VLPVKRAAASFDIAIPKFPIKAAYTALLHDSYNP